VRTLNLVPGKVALEVGAGTGKFTNLLMPSGATVVAVEPVEAMRRRLETDLPAVQVLDGTAEHLPVPDDSVDGIVAAQAFHWFDGRRALTEFQRVMHRGAKLALIWNVRDERLDWIWKLSRILEALEDGTPRHHYGIWQECFEHSAFEPLILNTFRHLQRGAPEFVVDRVASVSFIAALPDADRGRVLEQVRELLASSPETRGKDTIELPYETRVYTTKLRPSA
jgi:SAM-dependent methyltransferase